MIKFHSFIFYVRGSNVIFFYLHNQCNKRKPSDRFKQATTYLYDLYYHLPNYVVIYSQNFTQLNRDCHWLILGHVALTKIKCIPIVIH